MKTLLQTLIVTACAVASVSAFHGMKFDKIKDFAQQLEGKSIEIKPENVEEWLDFKAKKLDMGAEHIANFAKQIQNPILKARYMNLADSMSDLAEQFASLRAPKQKLFKKFTNVDKWLKLKREGKALKARMMRDAAQQLNIAPLSRVSDEMLKEARENVASMRERVKKTLEKSEDEASNDTSSKSELSMDGCDGADSYKDNDGCDGADGCDGSDKETASTATTSDDESTIAEEGGNADEGEAESELEVIAEETEGNDITSEEDEEEAMEDDIR